MTSNEKNNEIEDKRIWNVHLSNKLGLVKINLPNSFDTLFTWTQTSDCGDPCSYSDYRIQKSSLPILKESGFIYETLKDSVEQFTIKHSKVAKPWPFADTVLNNNMNRGYLKNAAYENVKNEYKIDTALFIDKHKYAVIGFSIFDTTNKVEANILMAATFAQGNRIEFYFEKRSKKRTSLDDDFLKESFKNLLTLKILEN